MVYQIEDAADEAVAHGYRGWTLDAGESLVSVSNGLVNCCVDCFDQRFVPTAAFKLLCNRNSSAQMHCVHRRSVASLLRITLGNSLLKR
jgi:hypothetical protein